MHVVGHDDKFIQGNFFAKRCAFQPFLFRDLTGSIQDHAPVDNCPEEGLVFVRVAGDEIAPAGIIPPEMGLQPYNPAGEGSRAAPRLSNTYVAVYN